MSRDWERTTLFDALTLQRGFDLPEGSRLPGKVPVVASTSIVGTHAVSKVAGPGVVIGRSGSIGGAQWVNDDYWPLNTTLWVKDTHGNDLRFLYYLLKSIDFSSYNAGSGVPTLNRNHLSSIDIVLPPPIEQLQIAETLTSLDTLIELNKSLVRMLRSVSSMLVTQCTSGAKEFVPLSMLVERTVGGIWGKDDPETGLIQAGSVRGIDLASLRQLEPASPPKRYLSVDQLETRRVDEGDLIIEASGTNCGRAWVALAGQVPGNTVFSNFCKRFKMALPLGKVGPRFIQHLLNEAYDSGLIGTYRTGTAMPNLDVPMLLASTEVPVGPNVWAIEPALATLDAATIPLNQEAASLAKARDELLPLLMSGRVRVKDVAA